jgi:hypothetical protein
MTIYWFKTQSPTAKRASYHLSYRQNGNWLNVVTHEDPNSYVNMEFAAGTKVHLICVDESGANIWTTFTVAV